MAPSCNSARRFRDDREDAREGSVARLRGRAGTEAYIAGERACAGESAAVHGEISGDGIVPSTLIVPPVFAMAAIVTCIVEPGRGIEHS